MTAELSYHQQPEDPERSRQRSELTKPLTRHDQSAPIIRFFTQNPDGALFAKDSQNDGATCRIRIGQGNTFQVNAGNDWLILITDRGRFRLTDQSADAIIEAQNAETLGKAAGPTVNQTAAAQLRLQQSLLTIIAHMGEPEAQTGKETAAEDPKDAVGRILLEIFTTSEREIELSADEKSFYVICNSSQISALKKAALAAGLIQDLSSTNIHGPAIAILIKRALRSSGNSCLTDKLIKSDAQNFGPYVVWFGSENLHIANKEEYEILA